MATLVHCTGDLSLYLWIRHGIREVRFDEARCNDCHPQLVAGFLAQTLGDSAHRKLGAGIDRHGWRGDESGSGSGVDEMPETLFAEDGQRGSDTVQDAFDVHVDHLLPILDAQVVEKRNRRNAGIIDENIQFTESLTGQLDEVGQVGPSCNLRGCIDRLAPPHLRYGWRELRADQVGAHRARASRRA